MRSHHRFSRSRRWPRHFALSSSRPRPRTCACAARFEKLDGSNLHGHSRRDGAELKLVAQGHARPHRGVVKAAPRRRHRPMPTSPYVRGHAPTERSRRSSCASPPPAAFNSFHSDWDLMPNRLHDQRLAADLGRRRRRPDADGQVPRSRASPMRRRRSS